MPTQSSPKAASFSIGEARRIVADCFQPSGVVYWTDFLLTYALGTACFTYVMRTRAITPLTVLLFAVCCLAYYRVSTYIHELVHLRKGTFRVFRAVWNLLVGIPFLTPSFMYHTHIDHHRRKAYGTDEDGEYLPLGVGPRRYIIYYLLHSWLVPPVAVFRFLILTPLSWFSSRVRNFAHNHLSSMVIDPWYVRPVPSQRALRIWRLQELGCFLWLLFLVVQFIRVWHNPNLVIKIDLWFIGQGYLTAVAILTLNAVRTLGAHGFVHDGRELTFEEQLLDSFNYPRLPWLAELWGPIGLRYHALHHVFPTIPYHRLGVAHRRLMQELPADSLYRRTERAGLWHSLVALWKGAGQQRATLKRAASMEQPTVVAGK